MNSLFFVKLSNKEKEKSSIASVIDVITGYLTLACPWIIIMKT